MVAHGTALVPTVMQVEKFPEYAEAGAQKFPDYSATMTDLFARRRETIMSAHEAGVPLYAGSDGGGVRKHGNIAGEIRAMAELGMSNEAALGAASWRAREWLGWNRTLDEGAPADLVVYDANPVDDLSVLTRPARVVLRGRVVA
jgi:imidazolonepropionase-like amidohydrolase